MRFGAYGGHHIGTARMGSDPRTSVVDAQWRVHSVDNLYVAGSAAFPTSSQANPTLTRGQTECRQLRAAWARRKDYRLARRPGNREFSSTARDIIHQARRTLCLGDEPVKWATPSTSPARPLVSQLGGVTESPRVLSTRRRRPSGSAVKASHAPTFIERRGAAPLINAELSSRRARSLSPRSRALIPAR